jgi:hypothetical protein
LGDVNRNSTAIGVFWNILVGVCGARDMQSRVVAEKVCVVVVTIVR